jgi:uncharacterized membrane protein YeaQ/YmgE (transglycosylase-associated protein family)
MGFLLSVIVGALIGWIASLVMGGSARQRLHDIIVGAIGALFGGFFLGPVLGGGNLLEAMLDIRTLLVAAIGSIACLLLLNLFRRKRAS